MTRGEKLVGAVAALWELLLLFLVSCSPAPTEIEWDRCYRSLNPDTGQPTVTYCQKDTIIVHE